MNIYRKIKALLTFNYAINKANDAAKRSNRKYYALFSKTGEVLVLSRKDFRRLRRKGYLNENATMEDLKWRAFYSTGEDMDIKTVRALFLRQYGLYLTMRKKKRGH